MSFATLMDKRVTITRRTPTEAGGDVTYPETTVAANTPAAVASASSRTVSDYALREVAVDTTIHVAPGVEVRVGDRVALGGDLYVVMDAKAWGNAMLARGTLYRLECQRRHPKA